MNGISRSGRAFGSQARSASMCARVTVRPSSRRSRFSSRTFNESGRCEARAPRAPSRWMTNRLPSTASVSRVLKLSAVCAMRARYTRGGQRSIPRWRLGLGREHLLDDPRLRNVRHVIAMACPLAVDHGDGASALAEQLAALGADPGASHRLPLRLELRRLAARELLDL